MLVHNSDGVTFGFFVVVHQPPLYQPIEGFVDVCFPIRPARSVVFVAAFVQPLFVGIPRRFTLQESLIDLAMPIIFILLYPPGCQSRAKSSRHSWHGCSPSYGHLWQRWQYGASHSPVDFMSLITATDSRISGNHTLTM